MSISDTDDKQVYSGNGSTTDFAIPFTIVDSATDEVEVYLVDITDPLDAVPDLQVISTDYTLTGGTSDANRTTVHFLSAPSSVNKVVVRRKFSLIQDLELSTSGPYPAAEHENSLDRIVAMIQMLNERIKRSPMFQVHSSLSDIVFPEYESDTGIYWDASENKLVTGPTATAIFDAETNAEAAAASASSSSSQAASYASSAQSSASSASTSASSASSSASAAAASAAAAAASAANPADDSVTNAKLANMATQTIKGRTTAGTGDPEDLTAAQATALLDGVVGDSGAGGTKGLVPAPAAGDAASAKFLKADGTWQAPAGVGTVTSVGLTVPPLFSVSGSPVTSAGTLAVTGGPTASYDLVNASFTATVAGNALTLTLKDAAGNSPSATSPVYVGFRNSTLTTGTFTQVAVTSATAGATITVPSGATLGSRSGGTHNYWLYAGNNAGTLELGICMTLLDTSGLISSTILNTSSDSNRVLYSTTARTSIAWRVIGRITATEATAGTWATAPSALTLVTDPGNQKDVISVWYNGQPTGTIDATLAGNEASFPTRVQDTHNAYNADTFTAPRTDYYDAFYAVTVDGTFTLNQTVNMDVLVNGSSKQINQVQVGGAQNEIQVLLPLKGIFLNAGETLVVRVASDATSLTYASNAVRHYTMITSR